MKIAAALEMAAKLLREESIAEPEREASLLLRHVLRRDAAFVYAHPEYRLNAVESVLFKTVLKRRAVREPFQYISGKHEFYGLEFEVTPDVLIPRPETEILVEFAIEKFRMIEQLRFLELGIGSGCISVAMLANLAGAAAFGVDISDAALAVASRNAIKHSVSDRLSLAQSDLFENVSETGFDLIVSNPPYIRRSEIGSLQDEVRRFEPLTALDGGEKGLEIVERIVESAPAYLKPAGTIFIEIGWDQSADVNGLFDRSQWQNVGFLKDLQGIDRTVSATLK